ncbi:hypothetical protein ACS0TY_008903 [Phlomoides rotata]
MDFLSNLTKKNDDKPTSDEHKPTSGEHKPTSGEPHSSATHHSSKSDLIHSAKVVADAANAHARREPDKYDKAEVAGATADLIDAAAEYGKLDDKTGIGKYVDKAEDLLRHYQSSHSADHAGKSADHKSADHKPADHKPAKSEEHGGGGGGGDFMKMTGDFLKK